MARSSAFDNLPLGYERSNNPGWVKLAKTPQTKTIAKMKEENADLKSQIDAQAAMMAELAAKVDELAAKKGKK